MCSQVGHEPLPPTLGRNLFGRQVYQLPGLFAYGGSTAQASMLLLYESSTTFSTVLLKEHSFNELYIEILSLFDKVQLIVILSFQNMTNQHLNFSLNIPLQLLI